MRMKMHSSVGRTFTKSCMCHIGTVVEMKASVGAHNGRGIHH